jgi:hypothetical protein
MRSRFGASHYDRSAVTFLTVLLVLGTMVRIVVLVLRPRPADRFRQTRRRVLATRLEQIGDVVVIATAVTMVLFGYGHHPPGELIVLWTVVLLAGFAAVLLAHAAARNHRPGSPAPAAEPTRQY